jgi:DNA polymerase III delta prime subunit
MQHKENEFLWVEKYRPQTIEDCILPTELKKTFMDMVKRGEPQNLLLSGTAGIGKTTVAQALCRDIGVDSMIINCSENGNIDTLRTDIRQFASTISLSDAKKTVILDEFDYSNAQSIQPALRGAIEEFSNNCRFIITCNYKSRIIEPIHSRCTCIEFKIPQKEKPAMALKMLGRINQILENEGVKAKDSAVLAQLIAKHFPDFRRILNELQRYSVSGIIDEGILANLAEVDMKALVTSMRTKDFSGVRKWVVMNLDNSQTEIFRKVYDSMYDFLTPPSIPEAVLVLAEYQYKSSFVADQEINLVACMTELMMRCEFK